MNRVGVFLITLFIYSCNYPDAPHHLCLPLSEEASSLLGKNISEHAVILRLQQAKKNAKQEEVPPILDNAPDTPNLTRLKAKEEYERLPLAKKQLLARNIVMAADWYELYSKFNAAMDDYSSEIKKKDYHKKADQADSWIMVSENPYIQSTLRMLRKDRDLAPLIGEARSGMCPIIDDLDIFEIVIDNYIELYPSDKRGWDFLWFMMIMEEDEMPQFRIIKEHIQQKELTRFPYGKKIYELVKNYGYVEATPYGRRPLE